MLDVKFLDWFDRQQTFYNLCYSSNYGVHIENMTFDFADLLKRKTHIPSTIEEQRAITAVLNSAEAEIRLATTEVEVLQRQKRGLVQ